MNRRFFTTGIIATALSFTLPTHSFAQSTGKCIIVTQEYGEESYLWDVIHSVVWLDREEATKNVYANELAGALESDDSFFLRERVENAPTFGDESVAVIGKHDADVYWFQVTMRTGSLIQKITFKGEDKDALITESSAMIEATLARQEYKKEYTDAELFALLFTEAETGLPVIDQQYEVVEYNLDNLG